MICFAKHGNSIESRFDCVSNAPIIQTHYAFGYSGLTMSVSIWVAGKHKYIITSVRTGLNTVSLDITKVQAATAPANKALLATLVYCVTWFYIHQIRRNKNVRRTQLGFYKVPDGGTSLTYPCKDGILLDYK